MSLALSAAYWCVLIACLLPYIWVGVAKWGPHYQNDQPRDLDQSQGFRRRAHHAHTNAFEALPFFIAAVVMAHQFGAGGLWVDGLAVLWVLFRIGHGLAYITDRATLRSLLWVGAFIANLALFLAPAFS